MLKKVWTNLNDNMRKLKRKDDIRLFDKYNQIRKRVWENLKESMKKLEGKSKKKLEIKYEKLKESMKRIRKKEKEWSNCRVNYSFFV